MSTTTEEQEVTINGLGIYRYYPSRQEPALLIVENFWGWRCGTLAQEPSLIGPVWYCQDVPRRWPEFRHGRTPEEVVRLLAPLLWDAVTEEDECELCDGGRLEDDSECWRCDGSGVKLRHYLTIDILRRERTAALEGDSDPEDDYGYCRHCHVEYYPVTADGTPIPPGELLDDASEWRGDHKDWCPWQTRPLPRPPPASQQEGKQT
jgi:hypothetical protein